MNEPSATIIAVKFIYGYHASSVKVRLIPILYKQKVKWVFKKEEEKNGSRSKW